MLKDILKHRKTIRKATNLAFDNGFVFCIFSAMLINKNLLLNFLLKPIQELKKLFSLFNNRCIETLGNFISN